MNDPGVKKAFEMQNDKPTEKYRECNIWPEFDWAHPDWFEKGRIWLGQGRSLGDCKNQIDDAWLSQDRNIS